MRDPSITVKQLLANFVARVGENVQVRRFIRYGVGEGQADGQPQADGESQA